MYMEFPVDIVVPWLNPTNKWLSEYSRFREAENIGRIRDLGTFKYLLRSIEQNISWVNKVFVLLYDEEQRPSWMTNSDKLCIVYHKDFIPKEYLPNFNSLITDMHIAFIKDLSEHFIFINDDMFFMRTIPKEMYFSTDGTPVHQPSIKPGVYTRENDAQFRYVERNMFDFVNEISGTQLLWSTYHLPIPFRKSFQLYIWQKYGDIIKPMLANSHIRKNNNICNWVFYALEEVMGLTYSDQIYKKYPCTCFNLRDGMTNIADRIADKYIACLNDGDFLTYDFCRVKVEINQLLNIVFPTMCSFESQS